MSDQRANLDFPADAPTVVSLAVGFQKRIAPALASLQGMGTSRLAAMLGRSGLPNRDELAGLRPATRVLIVGLAAWIVLVAVITLVSVAWLEVSTISLPAWFDPQGSASTAAKTRSNASLDNIIQRPLFSRLRQVHATAPVALPPPPPPTFVALERGITLKGVFINGAQAKAFLVSTQNPLGVWVQAGEEIAGWKMTSLNPDGVVLEAQNDKLAIPLSNKAPAK